MDHTFSQFYSAPFPNLNDSYDDDDADDANDHCVQARREEGEKDGFSPLRVSAEN